MRKVMRLTKNAEAYYNALSLEECIATNLEEPGARFDVTMSIKCHLLAHQLGLKKLSKEVDELYKEAFKKK